MITMVKAVRAPDKRVTLHWDETIIQNQRQFAHSVRSYWTLGAKEQKAWMGFTLEKDTV